MELFIKLANEFHPTIRFTAEISTESVNYLDTTVKIRKDLDGKNTIYTDLYTKDTDTHNYLHFTSSHPIHLGSFYAYVETVPIWKTMKNTHPSV